jgi:predicted regulator of Ras-like GTPase activity (Roadblock/LC7/MglB family)
LDLAPQEERIVLAHLESCESCAKFYHQLQQVILAAEEASLPDEILPANEEQLARMIMSQLPATKASPFAFFTKLFQKKEAPPPMEDVRVKRGPAGKQAAGGSSFPHRSSSAIKDASPSSTDNAVKYKGAKGEEFSGASSRLKAMNKGFDPDAEQRELQSRTLGEKFGKSVPVASGAEAPLTLAESIRKKISEGAKPADEGNAESFDQDDVDSEQDKFNDDFDNASNQGLNPVPAPQAMPGFNQGMMQPMAPGMNPNALPQPSGFDNRQAAPMGAPAFGQQVSSQNAPVVGSWGKPSSAAPQNAPMQQMLAPQPYLAEQPAQASPAPQPAPASGWGTTWDNNQAQPANPAPQVNAPVQPPSGSWGGPAPAGNNWNQAPSPQPPAVQAMQPQASPPAWGGPAPAAPASANPPAPVFDATPSTKSAPGWSQAPAAPSSPSTPAQSGGWGTNGGGSGGGDSWDAAGGQRGWGQTGADVPKPQVQNPAPTAAQPAQAVDAWGQPVAQAAWGQTSGAVNTSPSGNQAKPAQQADEDAQQANWGGAKPQGAWGTPTDANDWNAPQNAQQNAAPADAIRGAETAQSQINTTPAAPETSAAVAAQQAQRAPGRAAWSLESEQIETGTWQAFSPSGETLGARSAPPSPKKIDAEPTADPLSIDDRWSTPIQDRAKAQPGPATPQPMPQQGFAPPMMPPPMPAPNPLVDENDPATAHGKSGFDFPLYSPDAFKEAEPAWEQQPAPAQPEPVQQQPTLQQSVMQKLNSTLDESAAGKGGDQQNSWDLSIQEKLQAQQRALQGASMQQLAALPVPPSLQQPAPQEATWNAQPQSNDWSANQNIVQPAQSNAWGGTQSPSAPQAQAPTPQTPMPQSFQSTPAAPQPEQKSSLFSLDDQAIDQLFNENLKLKNSGPAAAPLQSAASGAPAAAANIQAPAQPWTPAPTTWAPEAPQAAPAAAQAPMEATQFAQPQPVQPNTGWVDNSNQTGAPRISPVAPRPNAQNAPVYSPNEDRRTQPGMTPAGQFAPPVVPPQAPEPVAQPQSQALNQQGLFNLDDQAMDQLFKKNLGVEEASHAVSGNAAPPAPAQAAPAAVQNTSTSGGWAQPPAAAPAQGSGWVNPPQNTQSGGFQAPAQQAPQAPQQPANTGWAPQPQAPQAPQQPSPMPAQPNQAPQAPAQSGWGQAAASGSGWGQQQQQAAPQPRIGAPADPGKPRTGLFSIDDNVIDSIFADNLGVKEAQAPKGNVNEAVSKLSEAAGQQNQQMPGGAQGGYGANNYDSPAPVKVEGVGRLDSRADTTAEQSSGRIASIGKFLLDQKDLEKIGNITEADLSDSSMRILTIDAASELQQLLQHIGQQRSVIGSVIIGHDGLLIANTLPPDFDAESMGQFALGIYMNTSTSVTKLGHDHVHQFVGRTPRGYIVIADFGGGLLVTISEGSETDSLIPLMRSITQLVAQ